MAVKIGESWVSEEAYAYAQERMKQSGEKGSVYGELQEKYKDTNFRTGTAPFQGTGYKNISIAPNILKEMENDPEKRMEYEALIYDCVKFQEQFAQTAKQRGIKSCGFVIGADGGLRMWGISEAKSGGKRAQVSLNKQDKSSWSKKLLEKIKEKKAEQKAGKASAERKEKEEEDKEQKMSSSVAVNVEKRARQIAAARSKRNMRVVLGMLNKDLADCQKGVRSGACDEAEVNKVRALLSQAKQKMGQLPEVSEEEEKGQDTFSLNLLI